MQPDLQYDSMKLNDRQWALDLLDFLYFCHKISSSILFFTTIYFYCRLYTIKVIHINLRIVMANIAGCISIFSLTHHFIHILLDWTPNLEDRFYANVTCVVLSLINFTVQMGLTTSFLMVAIERHCATIWVKTYEKGRAKFGFLLMLIGVTLCAPASFAFNAFFLWNNYDLHKDYTTCMPVEINSWMPLVGFASSAVCCFTAAAWLRVLTGKNAFQRRTGIGQDLSIRYQVNENEQTTQHFLKPMCAFSLMCTVGIGLSFMRLCYSWSETENSVMVRLITEIGYINVDLFAHWYLPYILTVHPIIRRSFCKDFRSLILRKRPNESTRVVPAIDYKAESDTYFNLYKSAW